MDPVVWVSLVYRAILFVVGIPGNLLIILVYRKRKVGGSTRIYIMAMAVSDMTVCLIGPAKVYERFIRHHHTSEAFCRIYHYQHMVIIFFSLLLMMMIAADRYVKICQLNKIKTNAKRALILTACCLVLCLCLNVSFLKLELHPQENGDVMCGSVDSKADGLTAVFISLVYIVAFGVAFISYGLIYKKVRQQVKSRKVLFNSSTRRQKLADDHPSSTSDQPARARIAPRSALQLDIPSSTSYSGMSKTMSTTNAGMSKTMLTISRDVAQRENLETPVSSECDPEKVVSGDEKDRSMKVDKGRLLEVSQDEESIAMKDRHPNAIPAWPSSSAKTSETDKNKASITIVTSKETSGQGQTKREERHGRAALDKTTKMMLAVTVVYFLTWIPESISRFVATEEEFSRLSETNVALYIFLDVLRESVVINYVINPVVYGVINKRFRDDALNLVKRN